MLKKLQHVKLSTFIIMMAAISLFFLVSLGVIGYTNMKKMNENTTAMYEEGTVPITETISLRAMFLNMRVSFANALHEYDNKANETMEKYAKNLDVSVNRLRSFGLSDKEKEVVTKVEAVGKSYFTKWKEAVVYLEKNEAVPADLQKELLELGAKAEESIREFRDIQVKEVEELVSDSADVYNGSQRLFMAMAIICSVLICLLACWVIYSIRKSSKEMIYLLQEISKGDLSTEIHVDSNTEFGKMKSALKSSVENFASMIGAIKEKSLTIDQESTNLHQISDEMKSSCENVTASIQDIAKGTNVHAEEASHVTSLLNEFNEKLVAMSSDIREIGENTYAIHSVAHESDREMKQVVQSVEHVNESFAHLVTMTANVGESLQEVTNITSLINTIADQTNLLALNAAIESARAGEAGKGFAVVANEVRKLAEQSRNSSQQITELISKVMQESDKMVENTHQVNEELQKQKKDINVAIQSFQGITQEVERINPKIEAIRESSQFINQQKDTILAQMESSAAMAEETSASSEEIASASEEMYASSDQVSTTSRQLKAVTEEMVEEMKKFKL
ncbi:methyl-accepting chemotaxis protein [Priestia taiwanensis]|uniref:Methyl-accepting chemotaxis protein n=1 Tax=Priestia taiwanensis TaxID=1347902 RepID=A0A917AYN6_9BACI|nr:methyl-accepting chemotaxis protein [Priestia taiwanensis]MBM7364949.1 methyl-accepting chemotaxis protein [Priestia taiwanensis]GGE82294.1 methyl-accepting chemotaxis protein [Priestia taiwanensis]